MDDLLIFLRKCIPGVHVDHDAIDACGLIPAGSAPVLGDFLQLQGVIRLGARELAAVDNAALQGFIQLGSSHGGDIDAQLLSRPASQNAAQPNLHLLHISDGVNWLYGADAGFRAVDHNGEVHHVILAILILIALHTAGLIDPGVKVHGAEIIHDGGEQLKSSILSGPVAAPVATALNSAILNIIEQLVGCAQLTLGVVGNGKATVGHLADQFRKTLVDCKMHIAGSPSGAHLPRHHRQTAITTGGNGICICGIHSSGAGGTARQQCCGQGHH
ncbi:hypothetical protein SDC9_126493 [bioreactor metagenome]|uniref:Uncharacterized protein n=1 Tax=bioreactor metagenome TaxID=1076179 RepID=A0A645CRD3_9ZZZZ